MPEFGEKIRSARLSKGINQEKLAELTELSQSAISQFEKGIRIPTPSNISKIAQVLEISEDALLGGVEGKFERTIYLRNIDGLSESSIKKINEFTELVKAAEKNKEKAE